MRTDHDVDADSVLQGLSPLVKGKPWKVRDAKAKLTEVMSSCNRGAIEVIGLRDPVVMLSAKEFSRIVARMNGPRTWGELFAPTAALPRSEEPLRVPGEIDAPPLPLAAPEKP